MQITIDDRTLLGAAVGACTIMVPITGLAVFGAGVQNLMSLGGSSFPWREFGKATAFYAPIGATIGGVTVGRGAPVWAACPAATAGLGAIFVAYQGIRRQSRRRYY